MGVVTASFGGVMRDILGGESPLILRKEIYVTAALAGAVAFAGLLALGAQAARRSGPLGLCGVLRHPRARASPTAGRCRCTARAPGGRRRR